LTFKNRCSICDKKCKVTYDFLCAICHGENAHRSGVMFYILKNEKEKMIRIEKAKKFLESYGYHVKKL
jgi:hypothetical protein